MKRKVILNEFEFKSLINKIVDYLTNLKDKFLGSDDTDNTDNSEETNIKVSKSSSSDDQIYKKILSGIGAPSSDENMKFFYAWRQSEGAKAKFNPFNTTKKKDGATFYNCLKRKGDKCTGGVRNYKNEQEGIDATIGTLKLVHYDCITNGLRNNIGAKKIAKTCRNELKTWGTGDLIAKVLDGKGLHPPSISREEVKTTT
jgi:hypothetical protein